MELYKKNGSVAISSDKKEIEFTKGKVIIDGMILDFPGEYEKSGFLANVLEIGDKLLFQLMVEEKNIAYIEYDELEITEEIGNLFGNIDILIILGTKNSIKIFENLEARCVIPFGEQKDIFFNTLGQHPDPVKIYKLKELQSDTEVLFINIE